MNMNTIKYEKNKYFRNGEIIQKIFDAARKNFTVDDSVFGNYASNTMIIIECDSNETDIVLNKIKGFYNKKDTDFYEIYFTIYRKTINEKINNVLIQKEIEIINPDKILYMELDFDYPVCVLSKSDLEIIIPKNSDKPSSAYKKIISLIEDVFIEKEKVYNKLEAQL